MEYYCLPEDKDMTREEARNCENCKPCNSEPSIKKCNYSPLKERLCTVLLETPSKGSEEKYNAFIRKIS